MKLNQIKKTIDKKEFREVFSTTLENLVNKNKKNENWTILIFEDLDCGKVGIVLGEKNHKHKDITFEEKCWNANDQIVIYIDGIKGDISSFQKIFKNIILYQTPEKLETSFRDTNNVLFKIKFSKLIKNIDQDIKKYIVDATNQKNKRTDGSILKPEQWYNIVKKVKNHFNLK